MSLPLENKLALVTGASGGIGSAVAKRLAADGAFVLVHYSSSRDDAEKVVQHIKNSGGHAEALGADLGAHDGPAKLLSQLNATFDGQFAGCLDILVNNAGTITMALLAETTDEDFDKLFNVNVRAMFQLSREAARRMTKTGWGRIVNMGSVFGELALNPGLSTYCGTKFAVKGLTQGWSRDLGSLGITVNNIEPAVIQPEPQPKGGPTFEAMQQYTSVRRFGHPDEIAAAVAFLVDPKSGFINGASLKVDGGWCA